MTCYPSEWLWRERPWKRIHKRGRQESEIQQEDEVIYCFSCLEGGQ